MTRLLMVQLRMKTKRMILTIRMVATIYFSPNMVITETCSKGVLIPKYNQMKDKQELLTCEED